MVSIVPTEQHAGGAAEQQQHQPFIKTLEASESPFVDDVEAAWLLSSHDDVSRFGVMIIQSVHPENTILVDLVAREVENTLLFAPRGRC